MIAMVVAGVVIAAYDYFEVYKKPVSSLTRNGQDGGSRTQELEVEIAGREKENLAVEVAAKEYTAAELSTVFKQARQTLAKAILGKNKSLEQVTSDLNLLTQIPDEPVSVQWQLSDYQAMTIRGELLPENLTEAGTRVSLKALLVYEKRPEDKAEAEFTAVVYPDYVATGNKGIRQLEEEIIANEEATRATGQVALPETAGGAAVSYYAPFNYRGLSLVVLGILVGVLLFAKAKQDAQQAKKARESQMLRDYPEIVSKLTLLIGAGMSLRTVWEKIVTDYEKKQSETGIRYAYEEMKVSLHETKSGFSEVKGYENFGKRCNLKPYIKMSALLSQNLRKGNKGLVEMLKVEGVQAFEERKVRAKRMGEEAGTKLLLPMFMMLAIALLVVVVPSFLSLQI